MGSALDFFGNLSIKSEPIEANAISSRRDRFSGVCYACKKPGHKKIDCKESADRGYSKQRDRGGPFGHKGRYEAKNRYERDYRANDKRQKRAVNKLELQDETSSEDDWYGRAELKTIELKSNTVKPKESAKSKKERDHR